MSSGEKPDIGSTCQSDYVSDQRITDRVCDVLLLMQQLRQK